MRSRMLFFYLLYSTIWYDDDCSIHLARSSPPDRTSRNWSDIPPVSDPPSLSPYCDQPFPLVVPRLWSGQVTVGPTDGYSFLRISSKESL